MSTEVHLYTLCWNEADMLGFFFQHYDRWVDRYFIYDDGSTDGSLELLRAHPRVEVRRFEREHPDSFVLSHQIMQNRVWKESRGSAAWVVMTAIDEHLIVLGRDMREYLAEASASGVTAMAALGYHMFSEDFPPRDRQLCETCTFGLPDGNYNKVSIFNPQAIEESHFGIGRHRALLSGTVSFPPRDELLLLHYKFLVFDRFVARSRELLMGLGRTDIANGYDFFYSKPESEFSQFWEYLKLTAVNVSDPALEPWRTHSGPRWWREPAPELPKES